MPKESKDEMSDVAIKDMFSNIGRAKEETAKTMMQKRELDEEAKRKRTNLIFGGTAKDLYKDVELDELERMVDEELKLARRGKTVDYNTTSALNHNVEVIEPTNEKNPVEQTIINPEETMLAQPDKTCQENAQESANVSNEPNNPPLDNTESPSKITAPQTSKMEEGDTDNFEIVDIVSPEINNAYLSIATDNDKNKAGYAFILVLGNGEKISRSMCVSSELTRQVAFLGAIELLNCIEKSKITSLILHTEETVGDALKRNAAYGIVDEYSDGCALFVSLIKKLAEKCFLRIIYDTSNSANIYSSLADDMVKTMVYENSK